MKELFTQLFASTQLATPPLGVSALPTTRNRGPLEDVFAKAAHLPALVVGVVYFLGEAFRAEAREENPEHGFIKWASGVARDTLRTGASSMVGL